MSAGYAKTGLYIDYTNHGSFSSGHAQFSSKKDEKGTGTFSGKAPALPHASGNPVESSSLDNPVESCSLDVLAVFVPKSIDWAFDIPSFSQFSTSTKAAVVDVCCSSFKRPKQII